MSLTFPNLLKLLVKIACLIKISGWNNLLLLIQFMTLGLFLMTVSMLILMIELFPVTVILLILFMMLLKVIMREGNMVLCVSIILSFPSLYWKSWGCTCFAFLCLLLCAFMTCFFTRLFFMGSGLDLNVFWIFLLMLSFTSVHISYVSIFSNYYA